MQAGLAGLLGLAGASNVQGEDQKKLDIVANEASGGWVGRWGWVGASMARAAFDRAPHPPAAPQVFKNVLRRSGQCCVLVTEEEDEPIFIEEPYRWVGEGGGAGGLLVCAHRSPPPHHPQPPTHPPTQGRVLCGL